MYGRSSIINVRRLATECATGVTVLISTILIRSIMGQNIGAWGNSSVVRKSRRYEYIWRRIGMDLMGDGHKYQNNPAQTAPPIWYL